MPNETTGATFDFLQLEDFVGRTVRLCLMVPLDPAGTFPARFQLETVDGPTLVIDVGAITVQPVGGGVRQALDPDHAAALRLAMEIEVE